MPFIQLIVILLGICGFMSAKHIRNHKTKNTPLICPKKFDCHNVVYSGYSKFLNMPLELLGMIYYAFISLVYLALVFAAGIPYPALSLGLFFITGGAFLLSLYLIGIQIFILKKVCFWCFISALVSTLIFILTLSAYPLSSIAQIFIK
ncbi:MAG: vitamin K epoxide reductase family protein [Minisyncoccia bacterium]